MGAHPVPKVRLVDTVELTIDIASSACGSDPSIVSTLLGVAVPNELGVLRSTLEAAPPESSSTVLRGCVLIRSALGFTTTRIAAAENW